MKKIVTAMVIGLIFIAGTACGGSDKKAITPITLDSAKAAKSARCVEAANTITEGLTTIGDTVGSLAYADDATVRSFLASAREFVVTSIETVQLCADLAPAEAATTLKSLNELKDAIDTLASRY